MRNLAGWLGALRRRVRSALAPAPLGQRGERAAQRYLRRRGYRIVAKGQRGQLGELDLVAVEDRTVIFVEVKTRRSLAAGNPGEAVDKEKQRRITRLALSFLKLHGLLDYPARFDIVAVTWPPDQRRPTIEHFEGAFDAVGSRGMFSA